MEFKTLFEQSFPSFDRCILQFFNNKVFADEIFKFNEKYEKYLSFAYDKN